MAHSQALLASEIQRAVEIQIIGLEAVKDALMGISDIRDRLKDVPGHEQLSMRYSQLGSQTFNIGSVQVTVPPFTSDDEIINQIRAKLNANPPQPLTEPELKKLMSITGYEPGSIKARLQALKDQGKARRDAALAKLDDAGKKHEAVSTEIEVIATQIEKEADDALQEFAQFTNGAPSA